ncbi:hypothetical protein [Rhizobium sp. Leaf383]|uniref:hypothetical protein n=1 Tax=Rhizobium sp. Leaf383 TaxID=1736357 RepID=UPI000B2848AB|nr:hypothetical protein [Rhizobium sp. Leaf383]
MTEFFYLDRHGRLMGSLMAFNFRDAHSWLTRQGVTYHEVTKFKPRVRKGRDRRVAVV